MVVMIMDGNLKMVIGIKRKNMWCLLLAFDRRGKMFKSGSKKNEEKGRRKGGYR